MVFMGCSYFQVAGGCFSKAVQLSALDPIAKYADFENECPFTFEMNSEAKEKRIVGLRLRIQNESDYLFDLQTCK
jgi:hypothetical protein